MTAVCHDGTALHFASPSLKNDKEVVMTAVGHDGTLLCNASMSLRNDKEVVMTAVSNHGYALVYASASLRNDKEVVMAAVSNKGGVLIYASESLRNDRFFILATTVARVRRRHRWPRLVGQVVRFNRDDMEFKRKFKPDVFTLTVDDNFMNDDIDCVGPQPTEYWTCIMNKRIQGGVH
jgi:hypothetical protein